MMDKAKAYDEALERARKQRDDYQKELDKTDKNSQLASILRAGISALEMVFPVLKESDDERIRKDIIDHFESIKSQALYDNQEESDNIISSCNEKIAWLKDIFLNHKKFTEAVDKLWSNEWSEEDKRMLSRCIKSVECSKQFADSETYKAAKDAEINWLKALHPQKLDASKLENFDPVDVLNRIKTEWPMAWEKVVGKQEWSEEDYIKQRALIDTLRGETTCFTTTDFISWLKAIPLNRKKYNEDVAKRCSNEWSEEDERLYKCVLKTLELWAEGKLYQYIIPSNTDRYINFFKSLKFRVQPQSKQELSKKDEEMLWNIISIIGQSKSIKADEILAWLKSIRPSWKPTKEHIDAIEECLEFYAESTDTYRHLKSLLSELVKL